MKEKKHFRTIYKVLITIVLAVAALILWSRYISTSGIVIREYKVVNNHLPVSLDGLKIVQFTDVHYGRTIDNKDLAYFVNEVNALKPDLIFFTGDLIDKDTKMTSKIESDVTSNLGKLKASIGKYAISGNHDFKFSNYSNIIKNSGFININNSYDIIYSQNYNSILIAGLESEIKGHPDIDNLNKYFADAKQNNIPIPPYKILLLHTPDTYDKVKDDSFDLVLAGHSHNGQIRLPFIGAVYTPAGAKKYYDPYYKIGNTDFYISGGLGTSTISFRLFNKPSFNLYRLVVK